MERRSFLKGLLGAAVVSQLPYSEWLEGDVVQDSLFPVDPTYFRVKDVIHIPRTNETMIVSAIKDGVLNVARGLGSEIKPLKNDDTIWILGSAEPYEEGKAAPLSWPAEGLIPGWEEDELFPTVDLVKTVR